jgi:Xaa-Pro aminopeptidase
MAENNRISRVSTIISKIGTDGLIFFDIKNIRYLTGFSGSEGTLIIDKEKITLLVDGRYINQAKSETAGVEIVEYSDKIDGIVTLVKKRGLRKVGFESTAVDVHTFVQIRNRLEPVDLLPVTQEIRLLRARKEESEILLVKKAAALASSAVLSMLGDIKPGTAEKDLALEIDYKIRQLGASNTSFDTIVASGANSALPHAKPTIKTLAKGDAIVIDYGAVIEGYKSDETCTFFLGPVDENQKNVYSIVKMAHDLAIDAIKAGIPCREIDRVARDYISKYDKGHFFTHATGHGVGLDVHESPRLSSKSDEILEAGMLITVEPGVYIPDTWGIRIEDTVLVKENGCEIITEASKELTVL